MLKFAFFSLKKINQVLKVQENAKKEKKSTDLSKKNRVGVRNCKRNVFQHTSFCLLFLKLKIVFWEIL